LSRQRKLLFAYFLSRKCNDWYVAGLHKLWEMNCKALWNKEASDPESERYGLPLLTDDAREVNTPKLKNAHVFRYTN
jgi:hypothetical protein